MKPSKTLKLIKALRVHTNTTGDQRVLESLLDTFDEKHKAESAARQPFIWRTVMRNSITKLAVAAAIMVVSLAGIYCFFGSIDVTTVAWGDVVENIRECKSVTWKQIDLTSEPPTTLFEFWVLEPGYTRTEWQNGSITVTDYNEGKIIFLYPDKNEAIIAPSPTDSQTFSAYDAFVALKDKDGLIVEAIGRSEIDGQEVAGFYLEHRYDPHDFKDPMHIWIDPQTQLPVYIEFLQETDGQLVPVAALAEITFDEQFDESLFHPDLNGYDVSQAGGVLSFFAKHSIDNASHVEEPDSNTINFDVEEPDPNTINYISIDEMDMGEHEE